MSDSVFGPRIIQNLLDTDFYKITMMQAVLHNYPNAEVEWEFRCRNREDLSPYLAEIRYQVEQLAEVTVTHDQLAYLEKIPSSNRTSFASSACFASTCAMSRWAWMAPGNWQSAYVGRGCT